jgi:hypothetical protein
LLNAAPNALAAEHRVLDHEAPQALAVIALGVGRNLRHGINEIRGVYLTLAPLKECANIPIASEVGL